MKTEKMDQFENYLRGKGLAAGTVKIYLRAVQSFYSFSKGREPNPENVNQYVAALLQKYKQTTVNLYSVALNQYLSYRGRSELKIRIKRLAVKRSLENVISVTEYRQLLAYARQTGREKYYAIIQVLAYTGIRIGELRFITVACVNAGHTVIFNKGRSREIFISEELKTELLAYCERAHIHEGIIFRGNRGKAISRGAVWQMLVKMADMTGIDKEKVHPHSFRHMMAIQYMKKYKDISELADILGHSSIEITRIYTVTTKEEKCRKLGGLY